MTSWVGGRNADVLDPGLGNDTVVTTSAAESTGRDCDTISRFNGNADRFELPVAVSGIDPLITSGALGDASFDQDLAIAADALHLLAHHAVLFTSDAGAHSGQTFLIVDANGAAGYQANVDYVFRLDQATNLDHISTNSFS
jgi:hypothetical protein